MEHVENQINDKIKIECYCLGEIHVGYRVTVILSVDMCVELFAVAIATAFLCRVISGGKTDGNK